MYNALHMPEARPLITQARVEAYFASAWRLLGWLLTAVLRGGWTGRGKRLKLLLSRAELAVEGILFLKAVSLYGPPPPPRKPHPRPTPPGFRRAFARGQLFYKSANIRAGKKAGALARVLALIEALAHSDRAVAHFFKRLCNGLRPAALVPVAPPEHRLACAGERSVALDDSS